MKVSIIGGTGMLGHDLIRFIPEGWQAQVWPRHVDIRSWESLRHQISTSSPEVLINACAYNDVDGAEKNPDLAFSINAQGPGNLADLCAEFNIPLVHFSTDYVFSGKKNGAYLETDPTDPLSQYGQSKCQGEEKVRRWEKSYVLRTSALYGKGRINHAERILKALSSDVPVKVATDLYCSPTHTADLAKWTYELLQKKPPYGIYHLVHKGLCSRYEFALKVCEEMKGSLPYPLQSVQIATLDLPAKRPLRVELSTQKWERAVDGLSSWAEGLKTYLNEQTRN